ncbi:MAG: epoxide hydrolase N-terminal domain-containing protein, partial [Microbacterium sp.]|nr:epoxide hydrolase N-terminal domain-containing protein [Microbacterium sp.]
VAGGPPGPGDELVTEIEGTTIHAVHVVGEAQGRRPLLLVHGWPGSTFEFWQVIGPLAFPSRHGGRAEDAFDLVIPSLPGFGFSGKPAHPVGARTTAGRPQPEL